VAAAALGVLVVLAPEPASALAAVERLAPQ